MPEAAGWLRARDPMRLMESPRSVNSDKNLSSLKFKTFSVQDSAHGAALKPGLGGMFERIGDESNSVLVAKGIDAATGLQRKWEVRTPALDHRVAMQTILAFLKENESGSFADEVHACGHRIVHGMDICQPALLTPEIIEKIEAASVFAPLHNAAGLQGIRAAQEVFSGHDVPQVCRLFGKTWRGGRKKFCVPNFSSSGRGLRYGLPSDHASTSLHVRSALRDV